MKKIILSIIIIASLLITSCSASGGTTSSEASETTNVATTTTDETTTTEATTTQPKQAVCGLSDLCDLMTSAMGKNIDESYAFMKDSLGTSFIFSKTINHEADGDIYKETSYESQYECDVIADGFQFKTISFGYEDNKPVNTISFGYKNSNSAEIKNTYEYFKAVLSSKFGAPSNEFDDTNMGSTYYGPINGIVYTLLYGDFGEDNSNTGVFIVVFYKV